MLVFSSTLQFPVLPNCHKVLPLQRLLQRLARPRSAGGLTTGYRREAWGKTKGKGAGDVLYKVAVTTGDVKNAGTDAKVRGTCNVLVKF